jgi:hypothetical protein
MLTPSQLTSLHRREQLALRRATQAEMRRVWPALKWADLDSSYPGLREAVATLVARNRRLSTGLAASYLRAYRVASGRSGAVQMVIPPLDRAQFDTSLEVTSKVVVKNAAGRGATEAVAMAAGLAVASKAMSRLVLEGGRQTVAETVRVDLEASGWRRILGSGGCDFCRDLAGEVVSDDVGHFHDGCGCTTEPVY